MNERFLLNNKFLFCITPKGSFASEFVGETLCQANAVTQSLSNYTPECLVGIDALARSSSGALAGKRRPERANGRRANEAEE